MSTQNSELTREAIHPYAEKLCGDLGKVLTRFVEDMILGIGRSRSVKLTEISRALRENISLHATHKRLSRNLADPTVNPVISGRMLELASGRVGEQSLVLLRRARLLKKYAKKLEYVATADEEMGSSECMFWDLTALDKETSRVTPLGQTVWSPNPQGVLEDYGVNKLISRTHAAIQQRGLLLGGRSCDRPEFLVPWTNEPSYRYLIRQRANSRLIYNKEARTVRDLAELCETPYGKSVYKYELGGEYDNFLHYGFLPVRHPQAPDRPLGLLVIKGMAASQDFDLDTHALLTTEPLRRNRDVLFEVVKSYFMMYEIVKKSRGVMAEYDLDDIRVLSYVRLKSLLALAMATSFYSTVMDDVTVSDESIEFQRKIDSLA